MRFSFPRAAFGLVVCLAHCQSLLAQSKPNIVFYMVDDLGWVDHSVSDPNGPSMGNASVYYETPTLSRLAQEGMSFTHAYAAANCSPARHAFQSGQYAVRTNAYDVVGLAKKGKPLLGFSGNSTGLRAAQYTLGEMLRDAGYTTAHFGKWHLSGPSGVTEEHGYDYNFGGNNLGGLYGGGYFAKDEDGDGVYTNKRAGPGLEPYSRPYTQAYVDTKIRSYSNGTPKEAIDALVGTHKHITDAITDAAEAFINTQVAAGRPFFMNLNHYAVHAPTDDARPDLKVKYQLKPPSISPAHNHSGYAALVEGTDQSLHRLLDALRDPNGDGDTSDDISAHTVIIFYSDNGGYMGAPTDNAPLRGGKQDHFEGGLRVPMVAWQPGTIPAGTVNHSLVSITDFYATFADLVGGNLPDEKSQPQDSVSIARVLTGAAETSARKTHFFHLPGYNKSSMGPLSVVIKEIDGQRYKLFYFYEDADGDYSKYDGGRYQLYNLTADISETTDLLAKSATVGHRTLARRLSQELVDWLQANNAPYPTLVDPKTGEDTGIATAPAPYGDDNNDTHLHLPTSVRHSDGTIPSPKTGVRFH
jgi:arylsulfatase A-like enzyme